MSVNSVAYSSTLGISVAVGESISGDPVNIAYTEDGINWNKANVTWTTTSIPAITWDKDNELFYAVSFDNKTLISDDGINWNESDNDLAGTISTSVGRFEYYSSVHKYIAVGYPQSRAYVSDNAVEWSEISTGFTVFGSASSDTAVILFGTGQANYAYSTDGENYAQLWLQGKNITAISYNPVAKTFNGIVTDQMTGNREWVTSNDGLVWSSTPINSWPGSISSFMGPQNQLSWSNILGGFIFNSPPNASVAVSRNGVDWFDANIANNEASTNIGRVADHEASNVILMASCCGQYNNVLVGYNVSNPPIFQTTPTPTPTPSVTPSAVVSERYLALTSINDNGQLYVTDMDSVSGLGSVDQLITDILPDNVNPIGVAVGGRIHMVVYNEDYTARTISSMTYSDVGLDTSSAYTTTLVGDLNSVTLYEYNGKLLVMRGLTNGDMNFDVYTVGASELTLDYTTLFSRGFLSREFLLEQVAGKLITAVVNESTAKTIFTEYSDTGTEFLVGNTYEYNAFTGVYPNTYTGTNLMFIDGNKIYALSYDSSTGFGTPVETFDPQTYYPGITVGWTLDAIDSANGFLYSSYADLDDDEKHINVFSWDNDWNLYLENDITDTDVTSSASGGKMATINNSVGFGYTQIPFNGLIYNGTTIVIAGERNIDGFFSIAGSNLIKLN